MQTTTQTALFRAGSIIKNRALLHKSFRQSKPEAGINQDTNKNNFSTLLL